MGDSRYVVEPNVKEGKGGLRDLHTLFWIGKYAYRLQSVAELVEAGYQDFADRWHPILDVYDEVVVPPDQWFHQHFNTSANQGRHVALRYSGRIHPTGFQLAAKLHEDGTTTSVKKGGTMIEYVDEDPEIRRRFETELKRAGMRSEMPQVPVA